MGAWCASAEELIAVQRALAAERPPAWRPAGGRIGGCFVCFERGGEGRGRAGDRGWAAAAVGPAVATVEGEAGAPYECGLLALREGPLLEAAVRALLAPPEVLLVNASGRDHPRRAGLALHLGAVVGLPTVGVTHRALLAQGAWPLAAAGARSPLVLDGQTVGYWLRTHGNRRPVAVHAAWRTDPATAVDVVLACSRGPRTPEPLRMARRAARAARADASFTV